MKYIAIFIAAEFWSFIQLIDVLPIMFYKATFRLRFWAVKYM